MSKKTKPERLRITVLPYDCFHEIFGFFHKSNTVYSIILTCKEFKRMLFNPNLYLCQNIHFCFSPVNEKLLMWRMFFKENSEYIVPFVKILTLELKEKGSIVFKPKEKYGGANVMESVEFFNEKHLKTMLDKLPHLENLKMVNYCFDLTDDALFEKQKTRLKVFDIESKCVTFPSAQTQIFNCEIFTGLIWIKDLRIHDDKGLFKFINELCEGNLPNVKSLTLNTADVTSKFMYPRFNRVERLRIHFAGIDGSFLGKLKKVSKLELYEHSFRLNKVLLNAQFLEDLDLLDELRFTWNLLSHLFPKGIKVRTTFPKNLRKLCIFASNNGAKRSNFERVKLLVNLMDSRAGSELAKRLTHLLFVLIPLDLNVNRSKFRFSVTNNTCMLIKYDVFSRLLHQNKDIEVSIGCCKVDHFGLGECRYVKSKDFQMDPKECDKCGGAHISCRHCHRCSRCLEILECGNIMLCEYCHANDRKKGHGMRKYCFCCVRKCDCSKSAYACTQEQVVERGLQLCGTCRKYCKLCKARRFCRVRACQGCGKLSCRNCRRKCKNRCYAKKWELEGKDSKREKERLCRYCYKKKFKSKVTLCRKCRRQCCDKCIGRCSKCRGWFCDQRKIWWLPGNLEWRRNRPTGCMELSICDTCHKRLCKNCGTMVKRKCEGINYRRCRGFSARINCKECLASSACVYCSINYQKFLDRKNLEKSGMWKIE